MVTAPHLLPSFVQARSQLFKTSLDAPGVLLPGLFSKASDLDLSCDLDILNGGFYLFYTFWVCGPPRCTGFRIKGSGCADLEAVMPVVMVDMVVISLLQSSS